MADKLQVFLSYAREDQKHAEKLFGFLTNHDILVWADFSCLRPGERWRPAIEKAIRESSYFIALLSSNSINKKGFVQKEIVCALDILDEFPQHSIFIIPARIDECKPSHKTLKDLHWVDLFPSWDKGVNKILSVITESSYTDNKRAIRKSDSATSFNVDIKVRSAKKDYVRVELILVTTGQSYDIELPLDIMVDHVIPALIEQLKLPKSFDNGQLVNYRLVSKSQGCTLDGNLTFRQNEVRDGEIIGVNVNQMAG